jgi:hypothetical protein
MTRKLTKRAAARASLLSTVFVVAAIVLEGCETARHLRVGIETDAGGQISSVYFRTCREDELVVRVGIRDLRSSRVAWEIESSSEGGAPPDASYAVTAVPSGFRESVGFAPELLDRDITAYVVNDRGHKFTQTKRLNELAPGTIAVEGRNVSTAEFQALDACSRS